MSRDKTRIAEVNLDYAAGIRKLCDGKLKLFLDKYLGQSIIPVDFYNAMKFGEGCSPIVERAIEEAYFEALAEYGLTHEELAETPPFYKLLQTIHSRTEEVALAESTLSKEEANIISKGLKFYLKMMDNGTIKFHHKKRSFATSDIPMKED